MSMYFAPFAKLGDVSWDDPLLYIVTLAVGGLVAAGFWSIRFLFIDSEEVKQAKKEVLEVTQEFLEAWYCKPKDLPEVMDVDFFLEKILDNNFTSTPLTMPLESSYPLVPFEDALTQILDITSKKEHRTSRVSVQECTGFVLAEDVYAPRNLPPFPASIKDGYAVRAEDGNKTRDLIPSHLDAGVNIDETNLGPGQAVYIATGAPLPPGADAVVMVEQAEVSADGQSVEILHRDVHPGLDVRPIGSDIKEGSLVLAKGEPLSPADIGLLATCGVTEVLVIDKPVVGVLSTGDELVESSMTDISISKIRDSNRPMLIAMLTPYARVIDLGIAKDEEDVIRAALGSALDQRLDVLVTSGGVSMGRKDYVKPILEEMGTVHFGRVLMKPGKPLTFATTCRDNHTMHVFGLPGNPVSSGVTATISVIPALRNLAGYGNNKSRWRTVSVHVDRDIKLDRVRPEYHRVYVAWDDTAARWSATSTGNQLSSRLLSLHGANALLVLPAATEEVPVIRAGDAVSALFTSMLPY